MVKFVDDSNKDSKNTNKTPKGKNVKISSKKNTTSNTNTIDKIQAGDSNHTRDTDDNTNDSMG